jgi:lipid II:glycine glycyltransferase (peptidoglycan interpeptide bridge formation enzyme)
MNCTIISDYKKIDELQWAELVRKSPSASFFQTKICSDFYASLPFFDAFAFAVMENEKLSGIICGYIAAEGGTVKKFFSRRAIISGGALLDENISENALKTLLNFTVKTLKNKAIYIEIRNYGDYSQFKKIFIENGFVYNEHLNFHIPTPNVETALSQMSSTKRRDVKISQKEGAEIVEILQENDLKVFYEILKNLYSTKIKTPLFPYIFFERIMKLSECKIFGIKYKGRIIGGSVCVMLKERAVYEWFACGLDRQFKNIYPSALAVWAGIEFAAKNNFEYFDMMGAGKPNEDYGVRSFKEKFGGTLVEHGRFLHICNPLLYKFGKKVIEIYRQFKD